MFMEIKRNINIHRLVTENIIKSVLNFNTEFKLTW